MTGASSPLGARRSCAAATLQPCAAANAPNAARCSLPCSSSNAPPGFRYDGDDPDGFRTLPETIAFLERWVGGIASVRRRLEQLGGKRIADRVDCDLDFQGPAGEWIGAALNGTPPKSRSGVMSSRGVPVSMASSDRSCASRFCSTT